ncbi:peptidyl-prolyl cis-trans isomerase FKBP8-like isoform X2 [Sceloporus undulatus]|uniref:peptidyl-prolyl cis-trans isomerase FKBP8-like isoform X2 n=1 Tax=Sceloporus undulatus TaxID=8520 RepID=UPI001C4BAB9D|nr:peptidyl-prolyl cis-trans isomerase FKBP8-like isoform X2 [Sceloporus undulatus]
MLPPLLTAWPVWPQTQAAKGPRWSLLGEMEEDQSPRCSLRLEMLPGPAEAGEAGEGPPRVQEARGSLPRKVQFQLPHTAIPVPPPRQEEKAFYQRLERLLGPAGQGGFQELLATDGWEDLGEGKCLRKCLVRGGHGEGIRPQPGQAVTVKLLGVLEDWSLVEKDPKLTFVLGQGEAIQALELGVPSMQLGEVALFLAGPSCAYGRLGREPDIPMNAILLYEVTVLQVQDGPDPTLLPALERLSLGNHKREWGNFHFEREDYQRALHCYQQALHLLLLPAGKGCLSPEEEEEQQDLQIKCLNNCAATQLKLQWPEEALASCNQVLQLDPDNVKALFRKGKLLSEQGEDQVAMAILKRALHLEPTTKAIHVELSKLTRRQRGQKEPPTSPRQALQKDPPTAPEVHSPQPEVPAPQASWTI